MRKINRDYGVFITGQFGGNDSEFDQTMYDIFPIIRQIPAFVHQDPKSTYFQIIEPPRQSAPDTATHRIDGAAVEPESCMVMPIMALRGQSAGKLHECIHALPAVLCRYLPCLRRPELPAKEFRMCPCIVIPVEKHHERDFCILKGFREMACKSINLRCGIDEQNRTIHPVCDDLPGKLETLLPRRSEEVDMASVFFNAAEVKRNGRCSAGTLSLHVP